MNADMKQKWVEALRSGRYKQGQQHLRQRDKQGMPLYCCLGVLGEVYDHHRWIGDSYGSAPGEEYYPSSDAVLPYEVVTALGLYDLTDEGMDVQDHLANMNDNGQDFTEIADYIEENL